MWDIQLIFIQILATLFICLLYGSDQITGLGKMIKEGENLGI